MFSLTEKDYFSSCCLFIIGVNVNICIRITRKSMCINPTGSNDESHVVVTTVETSKLYGNVNEKH